MNDLCQPWRIFVVNFPFYEATRCFDCFVVYSLDYHLPQNQTADLRNIPVFALGGCHFTEQIRKRSMSQVMTKGSNRHRPNVTILDFQFRLEVLQCIQQIHGQMTATQTVFETRVIRTWVHSLHHP
jgi:hypothetical protein